ncbi:MAG: hypothetical protein ACSLFD_05875, partial [Solirubrobacterales bacterium]
MREGPLADLFRSTTDDPGTEPPEFEPREAQAAADAPAETPDAQSEETRVYDEGSESRAEEPSSHIPDPSASGRFGRNDPVTANPG